MYCKFKEIITRRDELVLKISSISVPFRFGSTLPNLLTSVFQFLKVNNNNKKKNELRNNKLIKLASFNILVLIQIISNTNI